MGQILSFFSLGFALFAVPTAVIYPNEGNQHQSVR